MLPSCGREGSTGLDLRKAREQILAIVAHDLRNPLTAVVRAHGRSFSLT